MLLQHVFEQTARRHPDRVALEIPPTSTARRRRQLTYARLETRANHLAASLAPALGTRHEPIVALAIPRQDPALFVAQLAALKAGASYTCLDPDLPRERIALILEDSHPAVVLGTREALAAMPSAPGNDTVKVDVRDRLAGSDNGTVRASHARPTPADSSRLCYVVFTSGTTRRPKGVMIEHSNIVNLVKSDAAYFDLGPGDRVAQSSSAAFDSSIEETWLAFASGATLVVMDDETKRLGPDLVPWLARERITVFCPPPTLLRMCGDIDPRTTLPDLRILYVGGEELPVDVAAKWSKACRLVNGYGPTECAVVVTRARIRAGQPVTIGTPVSGNSAWILDESSTPVRDGQAGELCISGANVGRGYLGQDDLTAQAFVEHPQCGRIYRTGDLVRRLDTGDLEFLGRIDGQVQIRGHRVELSAIEAELCLYPGVLAAAATVQRNGADETLVAFVVPTGGRRPDVPALREHLARVFPAHMIPAGFGVLDELPRTPTGGGIDRRALPDLDVGGETARGNRPRVAPRDELEAVIAEVVASHLAVRGPISVEDDFFVDLGGNSLLAAQVISVLRSNATTAGLAVRDLYETPTVAGLAGRAAATASAEQKRRRPQRPRRQLSYRGAWFQAAYLLATLVVGTNLLYWLSFTVIPWLLERMGPVAFTLLAPWLGTIAAFALCPLSALVLVASKRLLVGRYEPGRVPYLSGFHVRHWIVGHVARLVPWGLISNTVFQSTLLRALGARIGRNVHIHPGVDLRFGGWDLLRIDDDVTLGRDVALRLVDFQDQEVAFDSVTLHAGVTVGTRARLCGGTILEENASLTTLSMLPAGTRVPAGERWDGVPAEPIDRTPDAPVLAGGSSPWSAAKYSAVLLALRFLLAPVAAIPLTVLALGCVRYWGLDARAVLDWLLSPRGFGSPALLLVLGLVVVSGFLSFPTRALFLRALGRVHPGAHPLRGWSFLRMLLKGRGVEAAGNFLSGTLYWPTWLRLSGMRVGRGSEVSSIMEVIPELVSLDRECFLADGIYLGAPSMHRGTVTCGTTRCGSNTFLGNHVVVPSGAALPGDTLLGVCTVADPHRIKRGTSWFGHPPFELPRREVIEIDRRLTHDPSWPRYLTRVFWESLRFLLPVLPSLLMLTWFKTLPWWGARLSEGLLRGLVVPLYGLAGGAVLCAVVIAAKWLLLGRVRPGQHPFWSCWCGRWDFLYTIWSAYARRVLAALEGTPLLIPYLRAMGCRIGRRVVLGSGFAQVVDPDMLHFEDDATVACMFQAHSFEDRVLKIAPVRIGPRSTAASGAVVMYGADIGEGARVAENSVVMKHEVLSPGGAYVGCPTRPETLPEGERPGSRTRS